MCHVTCVSRFECPDTYMIPYKHTRMSPVSDVDESCHVWHDSSISETRWFVIITSHVTCVCETCHTSVCEAWHTWMIARHVWIMSHVTSGKKSCPKYANVMSHMNKSFHKNDSVVSQTWIRQVTNRNMPGHKYVSHVTHMSMSWHQYEYVMSQIGIATHISCAAAYDCVMSHTRTGDVTLEWMRSGHMTCHTYE